MNISGIIKKYWLFILVMAAIVLVLVLYLMFGGKTRLGQEFTLSIGNPASIAGEDLRLMFQDVVQDNRCPTGAVCITEGAVACLLEVKRGTNVYNIELAQPGLYYDYSQEIFDGYKYSFIVKPYPKVDQEIAEEDYRLLLTLEKIVLEGDSPTFTSGTP
ncbi:hypothetical protein ACFLYB_03185 [Chloroflexota bacterium]